jgi:transcription-repair coupling factor (superfamily II helicase)
MSSVTENALKQKSLTGYLKDSREFSRLKSEAQGGARVININGLTSSASKALIVSALQTELGKTLAVVTAGNREADAFASDLEFFRQFLGGRQTILSLPSSESDVYSGTSPHSETLELRALTLWQMAQGAPDILVMPARSLITRIPSAEEMRELGVRLERDKDLSPGLLIEKLGASGYVREDPIQNIGQFSVRGGIVDVWPPNSNAPVRIEFFGDTVDSIREFDAETQLSTNQLKNIDLAPMHEFAATAEDFRDWAILARERFSGETQARALKDRTVFADEGESFHGWEWLFPVLRERRTSVFDYLDLRENSILVIDEPVLAEDCLANLYKHLDARYAETLNAGEIGLPPGELFLTVDELRKELEPRKRLELRALGSSAAKTDEEFSLEASDLSDKLFLFPAPQKSGEKSAEIEMQSRSAKKYYGKLAEFAEELKKENKPLIVLQTTGLAERLSDILRDYNVVLSEENVLIGSLSSGFELPLAGLVIQTENELFGEQPGISSAASSIGPKKKRSKAKAFLSDFRDLKPGDFVVHVDHGIGRFEGLQNIELASVTGSSGREFMLLMYADNAKLFVPVERLDLVSRYGSGEGVEPTLDKLGGLGWQKTKAKAKRAMRDMADELLKLYAERKLVTGFAFSADSPWQDEFEGSFPYELTDDQATSIEDVKNDMQMPVPMDRLLCGDVGYGKTEVAMRAAFKAVMDSKQVAVLTPTTVLAYQHYDTFRKRFSAFPVKIELLSRFRTAKEQKAVVEQTEKGNVDILIGTHRILSSDVVVPKLGLVVVDEEQRFGVAHKERLKKLKKKVDVLTLSATPIPRTLNMSLMGMRDMSVIETPPRDRLAINTQVVQFSESVLKSAIELELARNGQIFFIHNRVETIESIAALVKRIVPNARVAIGHGQMNEKEMENVMLDFVDYKYDVLVATTIIENGIDIPRANTIIINRADNYGLSQLYQLRGRVGRSNRRAYAYLLIPGELELTPIARRRLSAIREFSDLGAGFRIAALDLELRGAGNLLGGQQSGHLDALGFDLYTKMLERTVAELRGDEIDDEISVSLNFGIDVSIPQEYIQETGQRLRTYKRISSAESEEDLGQIYLELQDRYGKLPGSLENLFEYSKLRRTAEEMRLISIDKTPNGLTFKLSENAQVAPERLMNLVEQKPGSSFAPSGVLRIVLDEESKENILETARQILAEIGF